MKFFKLILTPIFPFLIFFVFFIPRVHAVTPRPIVRNIYIRRVAPTPKPKPTTWYGQLFSSIEPAVLGSAGVIFGALVAWLTLRKKTKSFENYFDRISAANKSYQQKISQDPSEKAQAHTQLKQELLSIQEEVELAVARKKLDQEQLIAVSNKIQRILDQENP
jgi:hypothetical protein